MSLIKEMTLLRRGKLSHFSVIYASVSWEVRDMFGSFEMVLMMIVDCLCAICFIAKQEHNYFRFPAYWLLNNVTSQCSCNCKRFMRVDQMSTSNEENPVLIKDKIGLIIYLWYRLIYCSAAVQECDDRITALQFGEVYFGWLFDQVRKFVYFRHFII